MSVNNPSGVGSDREWGTSARYWWAQVLATLPTLPTNARAAEATESPAGTLADGTVVKAITLKAGNGVSATILNYGATLQKLLAPDRDGRLADVVLGHDKLSDYIDFPNYFGVTVGRYANRISGGRFTLDGRAYQLPQNDGDNSLHAADLGLTRSCGTWCR